MNLALIDLTTFAKQNGINCAGSQVIYNGRFKYSLVTNVNAMLLVSVQFHKTSVPTHVLSFAMATK